MSASPPAEDHVVDVNTMEDEEDDQVRNTIALEEPRSS